MYDIIIIGGGSSGMMAAIAASLSTSISNIKESKKVLIIEHNSELGKKLQITGGGRCNILNCEYDTRQLLSHYGESASRLYTPFSIFGVNETIQFFKNLNIDIKIEDRKRAFPVSEKAYDVYKALQDKLIENKVQILLNHEVLNFNVNTVNDIKITENNKKSIESISVRNLKTKKIINLKANKYILSTGGMSHPETGSTGAGFKMLASIGLKINQPTTGLVPIRSNTKWVHSLSGKTLKDVKITLYVDNIKKLILKNKSKADTSKNINVLCTHFGLSGPSIINISSTIRDMLGEGEVTASIDIHPSLDHSQLDKLILEIFEKNKNKKLKNVLNDIYPDNILHTLLSDNYQLLKINDPNFTDREVNIVSREERRAIVNFLKCLPLTIDGLMHNDMAIITDGGLDMDQIDPATMRVIAYNNLHVTGDILDIRRPSGGYSLQLCWTTGYIAGSS